MRVVKHWDRFPRRMVPHPGDIQGQVGWGTEQPDLEVVPAPCRGLDEMVFKGPCSPNHSVILRCLLLSLLSFAAMFSLTLTTFFLPPLYCQEKRDESKTDISAPAKTDSTADKTLCW